jgi:hypothetical protein
VKLNLNALIAAVGLSAATAVYAGPVIIDGTDANDHGTTSGGVNINGWEYMQRALENLAGALDPTVSKTVVNLGAGSGEALSAITSAFNLSNLVPAGWTLTTIDGPAAITTWLETLSTGNTGILYLPTRGLTGGDMSVEELAAINLKANEINNFVGGAGTPNLGGGLFSMGETGTGAYGWLQTLIPGITTVTSGASTNITLTAAGMAAFPGLTNADLAGADPWHGYFMGNLGGLSVLGTAPASGVERNVILGGGAGTVIGCGLPGQPPFPPTQVPEPASLPLVALGGLALVLSAMRKRKSS